VSLHGYHVAKNLAVKDPPFYSLIMAAMWKADTNNLAKLKAAFPDTWTELQARYNAPLGALPEDKVTDPEDLARRIRELEAQP
jgi:hypothetical protein